MTYKGLPLSAPQSIPVADIMAGRFLFTPVADTSGNQYASFGFQVQDDGGIANGGVDTSLLPNRVTIDVTAGGGSWGDPHVWSFDGQTYDFQATGDFLLARALDSELEIQVRQRPWSQRPDTTLNLGLATRLDGNDVCFDVSQPFPLVNGSPFEIARAETRLVGQGTLSRSDSNPNDTQKELYTLTYGNGDQLAVEILPDFCINPTVFLITSREVMGLLGNNNGNPDDDLALRDGTISSQPLAPEYLYGDFAASWHVNASESLFDRPSGCDPLTGNSVASQGFDAARPSGSAAERPVVPSERSSAAAAAAVPLGADQAPVESDNGLVVNRLSTRASERDGVVHRQVHLLDLVPSCTGTVDAPSTRLPSMPGSPHSGSSLTALDALSGSADRCAPLNGASQLAYGFGI